MSAPRILVVGRRPDIMLKVQRLLESAGYLHEGALTDAAAMELMKTSTFDALLLGGGVEDASRASLGKAFAAAQPGRPVVEHFGGPDGLLENLRGALAARAPQTTTSRSIAQRRTLDLHRVTPSFASYGLRSSASFSIDPFLNLDDFVMSEPTFPPHPHAGFSAVTYMFEDSPGAFINRDSLGDRSRIEPGAIHWTQAARGMMHEEVPERRGDACHGLQMFVNLEDAHKRAVPAAYHTSRADVPEVRPAPGARVRVLAGRFGPVASPLTKLLTPITFLEVHLAAGVAIELDAPRGHNAFVLVIRGRGAVADATVEAHEAVRFVDDGEVVRLAGGEGGMQLLFGEGAPIGEPVVYGGPFVMTRAEDLEAAHERFARGLMGSLAPSFR